VNSRQAAGRQPAPKKPSSRSAKAAKSSGTSSGKAKAAGTVKQSKQPKPQKQQPAPKPPKPRKPRRKVSIFRKFFRLLLVVVIVGGITGSAYVAYTISKAPEIHPERIYNTLDVTTHIYDDKGNMVDEVFYSENRQIVEYDDLPDDLKNAFVAVEDKTFWTHKGFNFRRIIGAIIESFHGGRISGTSTITQQLARNVFLPEDKSIRSIKRKIIEMYYAYEIEQTLSKKDILTAYLNTIYLGYGCYGVDTASRKYFSKSVSDLDLKECAALAALPQAPGLYSLIVTEEGDDTTKIRKGVYANDASQSRRYMILDMMADQGYITKKQAKKAKKPIEEYLDPSRESETSRSAFKDYLIQTITADLVEKYDITEDEATHMIYSKGLNIYSTMNTKAQKVIAEEFSNDSNFPSTVKEGTPVESAMVITEVGTGKVKAMVGTRNPDGQKLFNRATNPRQPGSSIKPLTVYSAALQKSYEYQ
jgi:penicillin-binding protein 1A